MKDERNLKKEKTEVDGEVAMEELLAEREKIVEWTAREYVVRERNGKWYAGLIVIGLGLATLGAVMQYWSFVALVMVSVVALLVYVNRPARELVYKLMEEGLLEGGRLYKYEDYKAFSVVQEGRNFSIVLVPRRRFGIQARVYFPQDKGEQIVDVFGERLPMEELKMDFLDKIVKFLRI